MDYSLLLETLRRNSDETYNQFSRKITNSSVPSFGCRIPFLRSLAKQYKDDLAEIVSLPIHDWLEVDMLKGIVLSQAKLPFPQKKVYLSDFAETLENWSVCDSCVAKFPHAEKDLYFNFFLEMCRSAKTFVCRYGLVNLLSDFLTDDYIDDVFVTLADVPNYGDYYVDMAVAWLLATAMAKCRDKTLYYLQNNGRKAVGVFAYNKALQKMRDSFCVSNEDKILTKSLTRK